MRTLNQKLPPPVADARIEALEEAATHLELEWTGDKLEREQGNKVAAFLRELADKIYRKTNNQL